jgi:hypothetical protein
MKRLMLNVLALLVISGGSAHLFAQSSEPACCTAGNGAKCCGDSCKAWSTRCCADAGCTVEQT